MAKEGIVMIVAQINENDRTLASKPKVATFGFISDKQDRFFTNEIEEILNTFLVNAKPGIFKNSRILEDELRKVVRKHCVRKYKKYPMIVPTIFVRGVIVDSKNNVTKLTELSNKEVMAIS